MRWAVAFMLAAATTIVVWWLISGSEGGHPTGDLPDAKRDRAASEASLRGRGDVPATDRPPSDSGTAALAVGDGVRGRVVDGASGAPIVAARVRGRPGPTPPGTITVSTDATGHFVVPRAIESVEIEADGYQDGWSRRVAGKPLVVRLWRCAVVRGVVRSATNGTGVRGVTVYASQTFGGETLETAISGKDGAYEIDAASSGDLRLVAAGAGWISEDLVVVADRETRPPVIVSVGPGEVVERDLGVVSGARVVGRVLAAGGAPVAGASVEADVDAMALGRMLPVNPRVVTDAEGRFVFPSLPPVPDAVFHVRADGHPHLRSEPVPLPWEETRQVTIRLAKGAAATIVVKDAATLRPIVGAAVEVRCTSSEAAFRTDSGLTDGEGQWRIAGLAPGEIRLHVRAEGYVWRRETQPMPEADCEVTVALPRPAVIDGTVVLPEGVVGRQVSGGVWPVEVPGWERHSQGLRVDDDGAFRVEVPPVGTWRIVARARNGGTEWHGEATIGAGARNVRIDLEVRVGRGPPPEVAGEVEVQIVGPDGESVRSAQVYVTQWYPAGSSGSGRSAEEGRITLSLLAKTTTLGVAVMEAWGGAGAVLGPACLAVPTPISGVVEVRLPRAGTATGRVVDGSGAGIPSVRVDAQAVAPAGWDECTTTNVATSARTDPRGHFVLNGLGASAYEVVVEPPPGWLRPADALMLRAGTQGAVVTLTRGTQAVITVLDGYGTPVPGAIAHVHRREGRRGIEELESAWVLRTDATGRVRIVGLDAQGSYDVTIESPPGKAWEELKAVSLERWTPRNETVRLADAHRIEGVVRDPLGRGLPGVHLWWQRVGGGWETARTGLRGRFVIHQSPTPTLEIHLAATEAAAETRQALAAATVKAATENAIVIEPGYVLEIQVAGWSGDGLLRTHLVPVGRRAYHRDDRPIVMVGLDPVRSYAFQARPLRGIRCAFWQGTLPPSGRLVVPLVEGATIEGAIQLPTAREVRRVQVGVVHEGLEWTGVLLPDGRRYVIRGVPPGTWRVRASVVVPGDVLVREAEVEAGSRADFDFTR